MAEVEAAASDLDSEENEDISELDEDEENGDISELDQENGENSELNEENGENSEDDEESNKELELNGKNDKENPQTNEKSYDTPSVTWKDLGLVEDLCAACARLKWPEPTRIQREAIPPALQGRDVVGLAETGSGKTAAFALPVLQALLEKPQRLFALILTPTRELAFQISEQFEALGSNFGVKTAVIVGGIDMKFQKKILQQKPPHVLIATPGRLLDHLKTTKGFELKKIKYLVMDEADRMLNKDFEKEIEMILKVTPRERRVFLFSATMTKKVRKLQRACVQGEPVIVEVSTNKYQTVEKLQEQMLVVPFDFKDIYLVYILKELAGNSFMIFCSRIENVTRTALTLRNLGFPALPLHGKMPQNNRLAAFTKFKANDKSILVATDVGARGLDIPHVDVVINYDVPFNAKDYVHRVGRTARAGRSGKAITLITQYDLILYIRLEELWQRKLPQYQVKEEKEVLALYEEQVMQSRRLAVEQIKEIEDSKGKKRKRGKTDDGVEDVLGSSKRFRGGASNKKGKKKKKNNKKK